MAPGGKRGAKGLKTKSELSLGDLVLAKVKGYPPWPAKIRRPEEWERTPDPKKYFVHFFGTKEIAFVAPADIQAFTSDAKHKILARCQGKTVKYFAQAVREICEEFEGLQHKDSSGVRDDNSTQSLASKAHSLGPVVDGALEVDGNDGIDKDGQNSTLDAKGSSDVKLCSPGDRKRSLSPHISLGKRNKLSTNSSNIVKESVSAFSPSQHSFLKEEGSHGIKVEGRCSGDRQNELTNGHKPKLAMGSKKKVEVARRNNGSAVSHDLTGEGMQKKIPSGESTKVSSSDNSRSGLDVGGERKETKLLKEKKQSEAADDGRVDTQFDLEEHNKVISNKKMKAQHGREKPSFQTNETKISKCLDTGDDAGKLRAQTSRRNDSRSPRVHDVKVTSIEVKRSSVGKMENSRSGGVQIITDESNHLTDEDDPPKKRHRRALDAMPSSALIPGKKLGSSAARKNDLIPADKARSPVVQLPAKRKAVRLCADDNGELPKTPIHGGFTNKGSVTPRMLDSKKKPVMHGARRADDQLVSGNSGPVDDELNEKVQSARVSNVASSPAAPQGMDKRTRELSSAHVSSSPLQINCEKLSSVEATPVLVSPKRSIQTITGIRPSAEPQNKHSSEAPGSISQKQAPTGANIGLHIASDRPTSFLNQLLSERKKSAFSVEKRKTTPKSDSRIDDTVLVVQNEKENITSFGERLNIVKDENSRFPADSRIPDSVKSMKHLIAAAQARKKAAHLQNSYGNPFPLLVPDGDMHGQSPSPNPAILAFESSNMPQPDLQGLPPTSPTDLHQLSSFNQHENEELEERRVSSGHQATGSSLSGGTEAAVARDAFEGMIETLSRTKESIGRATRLAIDCAKYGIANEVVELLIQKLESESSLHRRVDLFFLVDSITQCSHSQRGIAGASYIPTVQAALPRLIGAVAPPSAGAQENRRQCRKVLRLWLERKILPESVLRRYMDDIGAVNDDSAARLSLRRPSRAERSIDDPIREMEGMVVDEYGSNATFQLPGLLSSHVFEEDEEYEDNFQTNICEEFVDTSPSKHTPSANLDPENYTVTPSDRRHCILEDVDGELEMEDVSGHQKEERPLFNSGTLESNSNGILESASNISPDSLSSPEGSPPLPPGSPPVTPPLPTSPPPTLSSPPPPPYLPPPPVGPLPLLSQQSFPHQPPEMPLHIPPLTSTSSTSPRSAYQLPYEIGSTPAPTGNQTTYMVPITRGSHFDASIRNEVLHAGHNSSRPVEYGLSDAYINPGASQHRQQFLPGSAPFAQRHLRPELPPQRPQTHFPYSNSVQQHQYPPYSLRNSTECTGRYANDEQMRMQVNEFNADGPRGGWMAGGRSCSGPAYPPEGYVGPLAERPPASAVNYQTSAPNTLSAPTPIAGRSVGMMPCRPDMSAVNWRPT